MTPRVTLILKRAFSPLSEKIATTWRWEFKERVQMARTVIFHREAYKAVDVEEFLQNIKHDDLLNLKKKLNNCTGKPR